MKTYEEARTGAVLRARELRRNATGAEKLLWRELRDKLPQQKWRRQMPVGPYFADFLSHKAKLIIELDGGQHASAAAYDARRAAFLESQGFHLLRFWNNDVLENLSSVVERIADAANAHAMEEC